MCPGIWSLGIVHILLCGIHDIRGQSAFSWPAEGLGDMGPGMAADCILLFYMLILFMSISWKPRLLFSILRIKTMFAFGWKLLCASLLDTVYNNIYGLVIGRIYNESMLGNYNRGEQFPKLIVSNLGAAIQSVMLPVLSASQDEPGV